MGIEVSGDQVFVNLEHERLVDTGLDNNPCRNAIGNDITVHSVFRRKKHDRKRKPHPYLGDGNPLIYALKGIELRDDIRVHISLSDVKLLVPNFYCIIKRLTTQVVGNVVVPVPSSCAIPNILATRLVRSSENNTQQLVRGVFRKVTIAEALRECETELAKDGKGLRRLIKKIKYHNDEDDAFSMKLVKPEFRPLFNPLCLEDISFVPSDTKSITLVDDLLSSGTTLSRAASLLSEQYPDVRINAVCLLSSVHK